MASNKGSKESEEFVYRISTAEEWEELRYFRRESGPINWLFPSQQDQVQSALQNFFLNVKEDLYLLQIDSKKLKGSVVLLFLEMGWFMKLLMTSTYFLISTVHLEVLVLFH